MYSTRGSCVKASLIASAWTTFHYRLFSLFLIKLEKYYLCLKIFLDYTANLEKQKGIDDTVNSV